MSQPPRILCLGAFPVFQRTLVFSAWRRGDVNRARRVAEGAAGKAVNAARAVRTLGGNAVAAGFFGGETGRRVAAALRREGLPLLRVAVTEPTRICQTLLDGASGDATELVEDAAVPPPAAWTALAARAAARLRSCRVLLLAGTLPPDAPAGFYGRVAAAARGRPVIVDSHGPPLLEALAARPLLVKPNAAELARTVGRRALDAAGLARAARKLVRLGAEHVLVTDGPRPAWWASGEGVRRVVPPRVRCVNPIGSGDALAGALALAVARGEPLREAVRQGFAAAAAACLRAGPAELDPRDAARLLARVRVEEAGR